jgi:hypothetical protein
MDWRLKALAFRVLDLPGGTYAHYFLQRHVTRNWPRPAKTLDALQNIARRVVEDYARHVGGTPSSALEIGAGGISRSRWRCVSLASSRSSPLTSIVWPGSI